MSKSRKQKKGGKGKEEEEDVVIQEPVVPPKPGQQRSSGDAAPKKKASAPPADDMSIVNSVYDKLDAVRHLFVGVFLSWLIGYMGFHISWSVLLFMAVYRLDAHYKRRGFARFYQLKKIEESRSRKVETVGDRPEFINMLMAAVWPNISNMLALEVKRWMSSFIEDTLAESKPPQVHGVAVRDITLGTIAPEFQIIKPKKMPANQYEMDFTLAYRGELEITIVATVGGEGIKVHVPVSLRHVKVKAELRIGLEFFPESPYLKRLRVAFTHMDPDWLDFSVKALGALNVLSVPGVKAWVIQAITTGIQGSMLIPKEINVQLGGEPDEEVVSQTVTDQVPAQKEKKLKAGEKNPFKKYKGHVKVELVGAKSLRQTDGIMGGTDAYCKLNVGDVWYKSATIKNSLEPMWNTLYEFPLEVSSEEKILTVVVKDWDATGANDLQGEVDISVSDLTPGKSIDMPAVPLLHPTKSTKGTVHLVLTLFPDVTI